MFDPNPVIEVFARVDDKDPQWFVKRFAWALHQLKEAGETGLTSLERPGVRLSHYVMMLRRDGVQIETRPEGHKGPFRGKHGRYYLASKVELLEVVRANGEVRHAA